MENLFLLLLVYYVNFCVYWGWCGCIVWWWILLDYGVGIVVYFGWCNVWFWLVVVFLGYGIISSFVYVVLGRVKYWRISWSVGWCFCVGC